MIHYNDLTGEATKYCPNCHRELPVDNYTKSAANRDDYRTYCKECEKKKNQKYHADYAERQRKEKERAKMALVVDTRLLAEYTTADLVKELAKRKDVKLTDAFEPRVLMRSLYDYGYRGNLTITVTQTVALNQLDPI